MPGTLLSENDLVISDQLNHASIIDAIRLAKAITKCQTAVYQHADLADLDAKLAAARDRRVKMVITDGVFSMEGADRASFPTCSSSAASTRRCWWWTTLMPPACWESTGRGTAEHFGVVGEVDIITSTLGKALGGAAGGFVAGSAAVCDYLTQRARPAALLQRTSSHGGRERARQHRVPGGPPGAGGHAPRERALLPRPAAGAGLQAALRARRPIIPVILGETAAAIRMSDLLLDEGVFVTGFGYPVVPQGQARVRCQISAAHTRDDLDQALAAFRKVGRQLQLI